MSGSDSPFSDGTVRGFNSHPSQKLLRGDEIVRGVFVLLALLILAASIGSASAATGNVSLYSIEVNVTPYADSGGTELIIPQADFDDDGIQDDITLLVTVKDDKGNTYSPNKTIGEQVTIEFINATNSTIDVTGDGSADVFDITNGTYTFLPKNVTPGYYRAKISLKFDTNGDNTVNANDTVEYRYQDVVFTTDYFYMVFQPSSSNSTSANSIDSLFSTLDVLEAFNMKTRVALKNINVNAKTFTLTIDGKDFTLSEKQTLKLPNASAWIVVPEGAVTSEGVTYNIWLPYGEKPTFSSQNSAVQDSNNRRAWGFDVGSRTDPARNYNIVLWDEEVPMLGFGEAIDFHFIPAALSAYYENYKSVIENYDVLRVRSWIGGLIQEQTNLGRFNIFGAGKTIDSTYGVMAGSRFNINNWQFVKYGTFSARGEIVRTKGGLLAPDTGYSVIFPKRSANANAADYPWRGKSLSGFEEALIKHMLDPSNDGLKDFTWNGTLKRWSFPDVDSIWTFGGFVTKVNGVTSWNFDFLKK